MTAHHSKVGSVTRNAAWGRGILMLGACALGASVCIAQTPTATRIQETNPNIVFSGPWAPDTMGSASAGTSLMSLQTGARASLTFTGTGITWIGNSGPTRGVARVFLDGAVSTVDTYSSTWLDQQALYVAKGLSMGTHTLSIEATQINNVNAQGSAISVDAFEITNGAAVPSVSAGPGYIEQNDPAVTFSGNWYTIQATRASGGSIALAMDPGSRANVQFNGTGITWIGFMDPWSGYARVYVDGVLKTTLTLWAMPWGDGCGCEIWQRPIYSISGLTNGPHSLSIEVAGQKDDISGGTWVWVDAFRIAGSAATGQ
jgi:hypothetical protein